MKVSHDHSAEGRSLRDRAKPPTGHDPLHELVICSLEPWNDVWRRNQFFTDALLRRNPRLRVLYVEPPADVLFDLRNRRIPTLPRLKTLSADRRLRALSPLKPLPRKVGKVADTVLLAQVRLAARLFGFTRPTLWLNDVTYAPLMSTTGWPAVYDVTDDWLLAPASLRERERLRILDELALVQANEVVVCSPALALSRGVTRQVTLVPNGVDVEHFRHPRPRPVDLPSAPTAVYLGTLHDARIDVGIVVDLATAMPYLNVVFVGPNALGIATQRVLDALPNVFLLGPRPYRDAPAYLQSADVVIVPHHVSNFTDTLDPIKAYECLAIDRPTVATPSAGFRDHGDALNIVRRDEFVSRVASVLTAPTRNDGVPEPPGWGDRARAFETALLRASAAAPP
jgi:teichuronic acid biosynthesis glycosyltransferase TuaH